MKRAAMLFALLAFLCVGLQLACKLGGKPTPFESAEGRFSVMFPPGYPLPKKTVKTQSTAMGPLQFVMHMSERREGACAVGYNDWPESLFQKGADNKMLFDAARGGAVANIRGTLIKEKDISLDGYPGRSIFFSGVQGGKTLYGRCDYVLAKPRLYQAMHMALDKNKLESPEINAFFASFRLKH